MKKPQVLTGPLVTSSAKPPSLHDCTKRELLDYFENTYGLDEWLFTSITNEKYFYKCPDRLRLPLIFYYAHPAAVFVNKFLLADLIKERVNEKFEIMFETGVDEMSWDDTENYRMGGSYKWPTLPEVVEYRRQVREVVRNVIKETELTLPVTKESPWWAVWMSIEHERIHLETSSVLIRQLPVHMVAKPIDWKYGPLIADSPVQDNPMLLQTPKTVKLGKEESSPAWGWDNEYGSMNIEVPSFEVSTYKVTNCQMLQFVNEGGYEERQYWTDEGWRWRTFREVKHPSFWVCDCNCKSNCGADLAQYSHCQQTLQNKQTANGCSSQYWLRLMFDVVPLPLDWPVEVTCHEAKAFCAWKGSDYRLTTEGEQHVLRALPPFEAKNIETDPLYSGEITKAYNIDLAYGSSTPVNLYPKAPSGCYDTFGNVWEWIEDHFNGINGFTSSEFYDDFSAPCFDGKHTMILGGSWISTGNEASRFARFAFRRHFIQHAGFRLCRTCSSQSPAKIVETSKIDGSYCEREMQDADIPQGIQPMIQECTNRQYIEDSKEHLIEMLWQQYPINGNPEPSMNSILKRIKSIVLETLCPQQRNRALVLGCGPGRLAFELTTDFDEVIACDTSARCIAFASKLKDNKQVSLPAGDKLEKTNGHVDDEITIQVPDGAASSKVVFKQLTWVPCELNNFNVIINLFLDRANNPKAWNIRMKELCNQTPNGLCVFLSRKWSSEKLEKHLTPRMSLVSSQVVESDEQLWLTVWRGTDSQQTRADI